jgi:hypothetical protein
MYVLLWKTLKKSWNVLSPEKNRFNRNKLLLLGKLQIGKGIFSSAHFFSRQNTEKFTLKKKKSEPLVKKKLFANGFLK